jgi:hypothetical protein
MNFTTRKSMRERIAQLEAELKFERSLSESRKYARDKLRREAARAGDEWYIHLGYLDWLDRSERTDPNNDGMATMQDRVRSRVQEIRLKNKEGQQ